MTIEKEFIDPMTSLLGSMPKQTQGSAIYNRIFKLSNKTGPERTPLEKFRVVWTVVKYTRLLHWTVCC